MNFRIKILPTAEYDLRCIYEFFTATVGDINLANRFHRKLKAAITSLSEMPFRFALYAKEPWKSRGIRRMSVDNFLVFYLPQNNLQTIEVLRILYGKRKVEDLL